MPCFHGRNRTAAFMEEGMPCFHGRNRTAAFMEEGMPAKFVPDKLLALSISTYIVAHRRKNGRL